MSGTVEEVEKAVVTLAELWRGKRIENLRGPNLIGVGSGRCGTSHLYGLLRSSPEIYVTPVKEANYFGVASRQGMTFREYKSLFAGQGAQRWISDITPVYLYAPDGLEDMRQALGPVRLMATLRNPVTRLVSHFKYHHNYHGYSNFEAYLTDGMAEIRSDRPRNWASPSQGIRMSLYGGPLKRAGELFGAENLLVLIYEDLMADASTWTAQLEPFLELSFPEQTGAGRFRNASRKEEVDLPKAPITAEVLDLFAEDLEALGGLVPDRVLQDWSRDMNAMVSA